MVDLSQGVISGRVFRTGKVIFLLIKVLLGVVSKEISAQKETKKILSNSFGVWSPLRSRIRDVGMNWMLSYFTC